LKQKIQKIQQLRKKETLKIKNLVLVVKRVERKKMIVQVLHQIQIQRKEVSKEKPTSSQKRDQEKFNAKNRREIKNILLFQLHKFF